MKQPDNINSFHDCDNKLLQDYSVDKFRFYESVRDKTDKYINAFKNYKIDDVLLDTIFAYQITANQLRPLEEKKNKLAGVSTKKDYLTVAMFAMKYYLNRFRSPSEKSIFDKIEKIRTNQKHIYLLTGIRGDNLEICMALIRKNGGMALSSDPLTSMTLKRNGIEYHDLFFPTFLLRDVYMQKYKDVINLRLNAFGFESLDKITMSVIVKYIALVKIARIIIKNNSITKTISYADSMIQKIQNNLETKSILIESLILDENKISGMFYNSDLILVYGNQAKNQLIDHGVKPEKIVICGNPVLDIFSKSQRNERKIPMVLLAPSRLHIDDDIFVKKLAEFCRQNKLELAVKLHPKYLNSKIPIVKRIENTKHITLYKNIQVQKLILECSILVTDYSSTGIHSQLLGIPTFFYNFTSDDMTHKPPYIQQKIYNSHEDLLSNLNSKSMTANSKSFADDFNWKNDGHALDRMIGTINEC